MKRLFFVLAIAALALPQSGQAGWWRTYGGSESEGGLCVQQTSDEGYIITGVTSSFGNLGVSNIWLIKLDSLGYTQWTKTYGEGRGSSVLQTSDGGYVISGTKMIRTNGTGDTLWTRNRDGIAQSCLEGGYILLRGASFIGSSLMRLDINGDSLWVKTFPQVGGYGDGANFIKQTKDSGYIVTGYAYWRDEENMLERSALLIRKTDKDGNEQWNKTYGGVDWGLMDRGNCARQCLDGGYVIAGTFVTEGKMYSMLRTDANGDSLWKSLEDGEFYCVEETKDGGFIVAGATEWATMSSEPASGDLWLVKTAANGDTIWTRKYGGDELESGRYVQQTADNGYIVVGYTGSYGAGDYDLYLLKTDSLGLLSIIEEPGQVIDKNWQVTSAVGNRIILLYSEMPGGFRATVYDASGRKADEICNPSLSGKITWGVGFKPGVYFIKVSSQQKVTTTKVVLVR